MILSWMNKDPYSLDTPPPFPAVFKKKTHEVACKVLPVPETAMDPPRLLGELPNILPPVRFNHFSVSVRPEWTEKCRLSPLVLAVIVVKDASPVMPRFPVNATPALVIVQSLVQSNVPVVSGVALVQLHSADVTRSKQAAKVITAKKSFMVRIFSGM
jgi:hypothetical protein